MLDGRWRKLFLCKIQVSLFCSRSTKLWLAWMKSDWLNEKNVKIKNVDCQICLDISCEKNVQLSRHVGQEFECDDCTIVSCWPVEVACYLLSEFGRFSTYRRCFASFIVYCSETFWGNSKMVSWSAQSWLDFRHECFLPLLTHQRRVLLFVHQKHLACR